MPYTGHVVPDGPAQSRDLDAIRITKFSVSGMDNNVYLLRCLATGKQLLIDAADDPKRILDVVEDRGIETVVTTHQHWDHIRATAEVVKESGAASVAHANDAPEIPSVTSTVADGDHIAFGLASVEVIHLKGHTPGSIALLYDDGGRGYHLFTGDSLFPGGPGRTTSSEDFQSLMDDLERKVFDRLDDHTWIYPGHGDDTTLGAERPQLPHWRKRGW